MDFLERREAAVEIFMLSLVSSDVSWAKRQEDNGHAR
jgi:hypothetical protein